MYRFIASIDKPQLLISGGFVSFECDIGNIVPMYRFEEAIICGPNFHFIANISGFMIKVYYGATQPQSRIYGWNMVIRRT